VKPYPALGRVVGSSRAHLARALLLDPAGALVGSLPVDGGILRASALPGDRWSGDLSLSGTEWAPDSPAHPLSGFTGHRVRVQLGSVVDDRPEMVTVADLLVRSATVERGAGQYGLTVALRGLASFVAETAERTFTPRAGETCQAMIARVVRESLPPGWAPGSLVVADSSAPVAVPGDYRAEGRDAWSVVEDLATIGNVSVYADAVQRLVIRPPLLETPGPAVRTLTVAEDVTRYRLDIGRDGFANAVDIRCSPVQISSELDQLRDDVVGRARRYTGPLGIDAVGMRLHQEQQLTGTISQAAANARAAAVLRPMLRGWLTVEMEAVPDPRLEPDDDIAVAYVGGATIAHRVSGIELPVDTGPMVLRLRTFADTAPPLTALPERTPHGNDPAT
jgi:hypothetical protein